MKMVALPLVAALKSPSLQKRAATVGAQVLASIAALGAQLDERRALRDRMNQRNETVDSTFWIYLR
jgi:hypothetical protein